MTTGRSAERPATTTLAPSPANASAVARPMPLPAPVTKTTLPVKRLFSFIATVCSSSLFLSGSMTS
jgi:hypothetical protein